MANGIGDLMNPNATAIKGSMGGTPAPGSNPGVRGTGNPGGLAGAWEGFFDRLSNDSALQTSMLTMGAALLQPRRGGQSQMGAIGQALATGRETYLSEEERERKRAFEDAAENRAERADVRAERASELADKQYGAQSKLWEQQIAKLEAENDPDRRALMDEKIKADIEGTRAMAAYRQALADAGGYTPSQQVQMTDALAKSLQGMRGPGDPPLSDSEAWVQAVQILNQRLGSRKTVTELKADLMGDLFGAIASNPALMGQFADMEGDAFFKYVEDLAGKIASGQTADLGALGGIPGAGGGGDGGDGGRVEPKVKTEKEEKTVQVDATTLSPQRSIEQADRLYEKNKGKGDEAALIEEIRRTLPNLPPNWVPGQAQTSRVVNPMGSQFYEPGQAVPTVGATVADLLASGRGGAGTSPIARAARG